MVNLLKEGGNDFDIDMDVLLKKSMDSSVEDDKSPKKEDKAKKSSKKDVPAKAEAEYPKESIVDESEKATVEVSGDQKGDEIAPVNESLEVESQTEESSLDNGVTTRDSKGIDSLSDRYDALYLSDCPLDEDGRRFWINNDLLQKVKIILWFNPSVSVSAYINNVLREHLRQNQSILEQRMNEVSASIKDESI